MEDHIHGRETLKLRMHMKHEDEAGLDMQGEGRYSLGREATIHVHARARMHGPEEQLEGSERSCVEPSRVGRYIISSWAYFIVK